jgi:lysophospholipase L1-like esterase
MKHLKIFGKWFVCLGVALSSAKTVFADDRPYLAAAIGDSITAGFGSNHNGPSQPAEVAHPETMQSMGAKRGVVRGFENKDTYSWFSGNRVQSHADRLANFLAAKNEKLSVINAAVSGAETSDLDGQVNKIVSAAKSGKNKGLLYLSVFIGSNDACKGTTSDGTPPAKMRENILKALKAINGLPQSFKTAVLISSLPRIPDLGRPEIANAKTFWGLSCRAVRDRFFQSCNNRLMWKTTSEYLRSLEVVDAMNAMLEDIVKNDAVQFPRLELAYGRSIWNVNLEANWLAFDCFHPNGQGQTILSEVLWSDQPWFH